MKIKGIKSIDFKLTALGNGVVNWNGPVELVGDGGMTYKNHTMPKLRGYTNLNGEVSDKGYKYKKHASDVDFKKTPMYISQNCVRHHLFRDQAYDLHFAKDRSLAPVLASITGLIRGYVVPATQCKRTSPLLLEDFIDQLGMGNFEQLGKCGSKDQGIDADGDTVKSNTFFSKTTFGKTEYIAYGSIGIENLQFISLDRKFDRCAMVITDTDGVALAQLIQDFITSIDPTKSPIVTYHENYVRKGTIYNEGEIGILLDDTAVSILVDETLRLLSNLSIRQGKGWMQVDSLLVDYNDSNKMMRIKSNESSIMEEKHTDYAVYYDAVTL